MSLISFTPLADGVTGVNAAATNTPLSTIYNDYNGNITNANISASAAIAASKVAITTATLSNPYKFSVYQNSAQTGIATATATKITFDTKVFDTGSNFSTGTSLFTAPISGFYWFYGKIKWASNASASGIFLYKNGSITGGAANSNVIDATSSFPGMNVSGFLQLVANDTVGVYGQQTSGGAKGLQIDDATSVVFSGFLVSAT